MNIQSKIEVVHAGCSMWRLTKMKTTQRGMNISLYLKNHKLLERRLLKECLKQKIQKNKGVMAVGIARGYMHREVIALTDVITGHTLENVLLK